MIERIMLIMKRFVFGVLLSVEALCGADNIAIDSLGVPVPSYMKRVPTFQMIETDSSSSDDEEMEVLTASSGNESFEGRVEEEVHLTDHNSVCRKASGMQSRGLFTTQYTTATGAPFTRNSKGVDLNVLIRYSQENCLIPTGVNNLKGCVQPNPIADMDKITERSVARYLKAVGSVEGLKARQAALLEVLMVDGVLFLNPPKF